MASKDESSHTQYMRWTWKAECGESRTLRLGRGKGRKALPIATNSPAHIVKKVRELIEGRGAKLIYLPPYSPEFNPIEHCWSKVKSHLRTLEAWDKKKFNSSVKKALETVNANDAQAWFRHCGYSNHPPMEGCYNKYLFKYSQL